VVWLDGRSGWISIGGGPVWLGSAVVEILRCVCEVRVAYEWFLGICGRTGGSRGVIFCVGVDGGGMKCFNVLGVCGGSGMGIRVF
jgi:hypothetical protein